MYPDREKALAKGRRKGKTFIRVFCGIFISVGIILLIVGIAVGVSGHTFRQKAVFGHKSNHNRESNAPKIKMISGAVLRSDDGGIWP